MFNIKRWIWFILTLILISGCFKTTATIPINKTDDAHNLFKMCMDTCYPDVLPNHKEENLTYAIKPLCEEMCCKFYYARFFEELDYICNIYYNENKIATNRTQIKIGGN